MTIDWAALGIVAVVSVAMTVAFTVLLAGGIRFVSAGQVRAATGHSGSGSRTVGFALLGCAGLLVLFGIYLILPISG